MKKIWKKNLHKLEEFKKSDIAKQIERSIS